MVIISKGLTGVQITNTAISTVGMKDVGLTYRGYSILDLLSEEFELVCLLLIGGEIPNPTELESFKSNVAAGRELSQAVKTILEVIPPETHPMDVFRTAITMSPMDKLSGKSNIDVAAFFWGFMPSCVGYWYCYRNSGRRIATFCDKKVGIAEHFLKVTNLMQRSPSKNEVKALNITLICYAEHDLNASTFVARVASANFADTASCLVASIGVLKGPKHGGANEAALNLINRFPDPSTAKQGILDMMAAKEIVMGFGHAVYKEGDPRSKFMKELARELSVEGNSYKPKPNSFLVAEVIEQTMSETKNINPNVDFFAALVYDQMGIHKSLFTVIFALGRLAGWQAHIHEQRSIRGPILIPSAEYVGKTDLKIAI